MDKIQQQSEHGYPLLRDAYAVIDGIPENNIDLSEWVKGAPPPPVAASCKTIACAAGWLSLYPGFKALGFIYHWYYAEPEYQVDGGEKYSSYPAIEEFFGLTEADARAIFGTRTTGKDYDPRNPDRYSDKELWKYRVRKFLKTRSFV